MHAPTYVSVSDPATEEQVAAIVAAPGDVYAVSHLCHSMEGRRKIQVALRTAGLSPERARCLGWSTGFPPGFEPPAPTRDVEDATPAQPSIDPDSPTSVMEQEPWMTDPAEQTGSVPPPSQDADAPAPSSETPSRRR